MVLITAAVVLLLLVAGGYALFSGGEDTKKVTAHFPQAIGLYAGSSVRVLGVEVGTITKVQPEGTTVRVDMEYKASQKLPENVTATIVPPSIISDRYVQFGPVYNGGPVLADKADLPAARTGAPVEVDKIFESLNTLNTALGPDGANKNGALSRLISVGAANLDGNGAQIKQTNHDLSEAISTLANSKDELFSTVANLANFNQALANSDGQVRTLNVDLADVAEQLNGERQDLAAALANLAVALGQVADFVRTNKDDLATDVAGLGQITGILVKQKASLTEFMDDAPLALQNLNNAFNPDSGTLDTRNNAQQGPEDVRKAICPASTSPLGSLLMGLCGK